VAVRQRPAGLPPEGPSHVIRVESRRLFALRDGDPVPASLVGVRRKGVPGTDCYPSETASSDSAAPCTWRLRALLLFPKQPLSALGVPLFGDASPAECQ
jgi:hypothetical protein